MSTNITTSTGNTTSTGEKQALRLLIPLPLIRQAKSHAALRGKSLSKIVQGLIEEWIEENQNQEK